MSRELLKLINEKFTSGNSIEVERITITRAEYEDLLAKPEQGEIVVSKNPLGQIVAVTRQDEDGRILKVIDTSAKPEQKPFTLVCPKCGADRTKESCKGDLSNCWLKGFAHTQPEQQSTSTNNLGGQAVIYPVSNLEQKLIGWINGEPQYAKPEQASGFKLSHDTIIQRDVDYGWSGLASVEGVTVTSEPIAKPEQEPFTLVCPKCGADRTKESCKGDLSNCWLKGFAHTQPERKHIGWENGERKYVELPQAEKQEPVAWMDEKFTGPYVEALNEFWHPKAKRKWVGLTDKDIENIYKANHDLYGNDIFGNYERAIEAKLKELNG
jgi:hypothetical protein